MLSLNPIDQSALEHLLTASAVRSTHIIGHPGGWYVVFQYGTTESVLSSRDGATRIFRKLDTLVNFLKKRDVLQYRVDAQLHGPAASGKTCVNAYASHRMRKIHQVAAEAALLQKSNSARH